MATELKCDHIRFSRLRDLVKFHGPDELNEITYVASATNFRRALLNEFGKDDLDIDHEIETNADTTMTYLGYRRFLVSDLQYIFPLSDGRSKTAYKKHVKYLAKQMLVRGYVSSINE
jgi:ATP-binding cassette, subfamily G (WHITE), member 2, PDR